MTESATIEYLAAEVRQLRQRVQDLEDAQELEAAIRDNQGAPLIPWGSAKSDLEL